MKNNRALTVAVGVGGLLAPMATVNAQMMCMAAGGNAGYCRYGSTPSWWCYDANGVHPNPDGDYDYSMFTASCNPCMCS